MTLNTLARNWTFTEFLIRPANVLPQIGGFDAMTTGHYRAYVTSAPRDLTIDRVGFGMADATSSPQATVSIEAVNTSTGFLSGVWDTGTDGTSGVLTNGWQVVVLDAAAVIPMGSAFGVKVAVAAGSMAIREVAGVNASVEGLPYHIRNTDGTPVLRAMTGATVALGNATEWYSLPGFYPLTGVSDLAWDNTSGILKRGLKIVPKFTAEIGAVRLVHHISRLGNYDIVVENSLGEEFPRTFVEGEWKRPLQRYVDRAIEARPRLEKGETYRVYLEPQEAEDIHLSRFGLPSTDYLPAWADTGYQYTEHDGANWTDTAAIPALEPYLRAI